MAVLVNMRGNEQDLLEQIQDKFPFKLSATGAMILGLKFLAFACKEVIEPDKEFIEEVERVYQLIKGIRRSREAGDRLSDVFSEAALESTTNTANVVKQQTEPEDSDTIEDGDIFSDVDITGGD